MCVPIKSNTSTILIFILPKFIGLYHQHVIICLLLADLCFTRTVQEIGSVIKLVRQIFTFSVFKNNFQSIFVVHTIFLSLSRRRHLLFFPRHCQQDCPISATLATSTPSFNVCLISTTLVIISYSSITSKLMLSALSYLFLSPVDIIFLHKCIVVFTR